MNAPKRIVTVVFIIGIFMISDLAWSGLGGREKPGSTAGLSENIHVTTEKQEYRPGEIVKVTIRNQSGGIISCHVGVEGIKHIEKKTAEGNWEKLFAMCQPPHCFFDIGPPQEIRAGEFKVFDWKPLIYVNGTAKVVQASPGEYRLLLLYHDRQRKEWRPVYSNVFSIGAP